MLKDYGIKPSAMVIYPLNGILENAILPDTKKILDAVASII